MTTKTEPKTVLFLGKRYRIAGLAFCSPNTPYPVSLEKMYGGWDALTSGRLFPYDHSDPSSLSCHTAQEAASALERDVLEMFTNFADALGYEVDG